MERKQNDKYNMLLAVEGHFDDNPIIWGSNIPVTDIKNLLSGMIDQITAAVTKQSITSSGATLNKSRLRKDLEEKGLFVSSVLSAFASTNSTYGELYKQVHINKSAFEEFRDNDIVAAVERLNSEAITVIENLGPYGITEETLADMMAARDAFFTVVKRPERVTEARKTATDLIVELLHEAVSLLDIQMDPMMAVFKTTQPEFYSVYFNLRKIHSTGTRTMSLEILTLDAGTNAPLEGAHLEVVGKRIKRISNLSGQNRVQNLLEGNYTLSVSCLNFVPQMIPFTIMNHQTTQLVIEMQKVLTNVLEQEEAEE